MELTPHEIAELNELILSELLSDGGGILGRYGEWHLDGVGTLKVERVSAERHGRRISPPYKRIIFYKENLSNVNNFPLSREVDEILNPLGHKQLVIRRKSRFWVVFLWIFAVILLITGGYFLWQTGSKSASEPLQSQLIPVPKTQRVTTRPQALERIPTDSLDMLHGRTYVILGTFQYEVNARFVMEQLPGSRVYRLDGKWAVVVYESDSRQQAQTFIARDTLYRNEYKPWAYTKK